MSWIPALKFGLHLKTMNPHEYQEEVLKAIINRTLDDTRHRFIRAGTISAGGGMMPGGGGIGLRFAVR